MALASAPPTRKEKQELGCSACLSFQRRRKEGKKVSDTRGSPPREPRIVDPGGL